MKKKIIWIVLAVLIIVAIAYKMKAGSDPISVEIEKVKKEDIEKFVEESAVVKLENETSIYSVAGGRILEVLPVVGETINKGDILAKMDDSQLKLGIKALELKKQALSAQYDEAVKGVSQNEIRKLEALIKSAEASYNSANRAAQNNKKLYEAGAISEDTYQNSLTSLASAEATLEAAKTSLDIANQGKSEFVRKQYQAQISELQLQINESTKNLNDLIVKSPISGTMMSSEIAAGKTIQPGALLFQIGDIGHIYLESELLISDIGDVKVGSPVLINNDDLGINPIKGTVRKIYPKAFSKISELGIEQKRIKIEIDFNEATALLKPEYDMDISIITDSKTSALTVSEKAIFEIDGKSSVFINEDGILKVRQIEKGIESKDRIEILNGLKEGDEVILSPDISLKEGMKIKVSQ